MNKKIISLFLAVAMLATMVAGCAPVGPQAAPAAEPAADAAAEAVTLEFTQWWAPELPEGAFRALMDEFEALNPGIKVELISGPYSTTKEQVVAGAAAGTIEVKYRRTGEKCEISPEAAIAKVVENYKAKVA